MTASFADTLQPFVVDGRERGTFFSLRALEASTDVGLSRWPVCMRLLLEAVLRHSARPEAGREAVLSLLAWQPQGGARSEVPFFPARVLAPDASGIPLFADLCAMRERANAIGCDPDAVQPFVPVDLVIDHSLQVDRAGSADALAHNIREEFRRNEERYSFLKWAAGAFRGVQVVPPGMGILHQVNMEHLASPIRRSDEGVYSPDSVVGPDSHTCMANGLGLLAWGVGGIEAESVMLGQPLSLPAPDVVGVELRGRLPAGATATDLVLHVTHLLRSQGVVGSFVEFFGDGAAHLRAEDRCTVSNMAPEYGATIAYFPVDGETLDYFAGTGRDSQAIADARAWFEQQGLFGIPRAGAIDYSRTIVIDLASIVPCVAGPSRPQDLVALAQVPASLPAHTSASTVSQGEVKDGDIVIAAITSCANTSNPAALITAALVAQAAAARGLRVPPHVKTSFAPGSQAAAAYLCATGLQQPLDALGFQVVGFGCATCVGNSGPLAPAIEAQLSREPRMVAAVLSGNRNFEGRTHPLVKAGYLMSPALVVAYALAGSVKLNLVEDSIGIDKDGKAVHLRDLWPDEASITRWLGAARQPATVLASYADTKRTYGLWEELSAPGGASFAWEDTSTYLRRPPYFETEPRTGDASLKGARALLILGDSVTTDHISPGGTIAASSPAGQYLSALGVRTADFNTYIARRANHEVMVRGTFASPRLRNAMPGVPEGGLTRHQPDGAVLPVFEAALRYREDEVPLVVIVGKEYGTGSSRDWAAKGTMLLGVRAVIAQSFERIHRSNLVGMGVLPCEFLPGEDARTLHLKGDEVFDLEVPSGLVQGKTPLRLDIRRADGRVTTTHVVPRIDTPAESRQFAQGGILHAALRSVVDAARRESTEAQA